MEKQIITFTANEQDLRILSPFRASTNKVAYIEAHFDLGDNWSGYDSVRAVWNNGFVCISTVLDSLGNCIVPYEVMQRKSTVKVNLVGSISDGDTLTDRLTSYPVKAVLVDEVAYICGAETQPITPSQFEQFAAAVHDDASRAATSAADAQAFMESSRTYAQTATQEASNASASAQRAQGLATAAEQYAIASAQSADSAAASASSASADADRAEQAAADAGFMEFHIDDNGHLIMEHTDSVDDIDFSLVNGHLILEVA